MEKIKIVEAIHHEQKQNKSNIVGINEAKRKLIETY
jgi:hypothetical protein